jgi:hypothetical protein
MEFQQTFGTTGSNLVLENVRLKCGTTLARSPKAIRLVSSVEGLRPELPGHRVAGYLRADCVGAGEVRSSIYDSKVLIREAAEP